MRASRSASLGAAAWLAAWLGGCAVGPNYHAPNTAAPAAFAAMSVAAEPDPGAPRLAASEPAASEPAAPLSQWWRSLNDPELDALIERAILANPDIELALTRLQEARTREAVYVGGALPAVAASGAAGRGTGTDFSSAGALPPLRAADNRGSLQQIRQVAGFSTSWEIDLFGGRRREIEAGRDDIEAAASTRLAVLISVVADVARDYIDMRGLQTRLAILRANITTAQQSRDFQRTRYERGLTNELDYQLASRELAALEAELPPLHSAIQAVQYDIALLLGRYPEDLVDELNRPGVLPNVPEGIEPGLPLELLRRRPDVRAAERDLAAATARIGVATANLFPRVSLSGGLGSQSGDIGAHGTHIWSLGPSVYWPVLDFGALDASVSVADLQAHERLIDYRKTIIAAVQDADKAIAHYRAQEQRLSRLAEAISAGERAVSLAQQRFDRGLTDFLNVVDAERAQYSLEDQYTASQQGTAEAYIYLYKALGGGWESYQKIPAVRRPEPAVMAAFHRVLGGDDPQK